jgi:hypothetical protein
MAKRIAYVAPADRPTGEPTVHLTAACETHRHPACKGLVLSLLHTGACECSCHQPAGVAA